MRVAPRAAFLSRLYGRISVSPDTGHARGKITSRPARTRSHTIVARNSIIVRRLVVIRVVYLCVGSVGRGGLIFSDARTVISSFDKSIIFHADKYTGQVRQTSDLIPYVVHTHTHIYAVCGRARLHQLWTSLGDVETRSRGPRVCVY